MASLKENICGSSGHHLRATVQKSENFNPTLFCLRNLFLWCRSLDFWHQLVYLLSSTVGSLSSYIAVIVYVFMAIIVFSSHSIINFSDKVFHVALQLLCNPSYQLTLCVSSKILPPCTCPITWWREPLCWRSLHWSKRCCSPLNLLVTTSVVYSIKVVQLLCTHSNVINSLCLFVLKENSY